MSDQTVDDLIRDGKATPIGLSINEYTAGTASEQPGYVALQTGDTVHYLRPNVARALAEGLRWGARYAEEPKKES